MRSALYAVRQTHMYVYLYDQYTKEKKYQSIIKQMENRLTDIGIAGKVVRLQNFTNADSIIEQEMKQGVTTVVVVGNDETFGHVLSRAAHRNVTFGFIPVGERGNTIAPILGIPFNDDACDVLSRRRKMDLDVGWFNGRFFVNQIYIAPSHIEVQYDERFVVSSETGKIELVVCNLLPFSWRDTKTQGFIIHPQDGKLEAFLRPLKKVGWLRQEYEEPSVFPFTEMVVRSQKPFVVVADGKESKEISITIKLAKEKISMVVGKERQF